jgi:hypothetical protein
MNVICNEMPNEEILFLPNDRVAFQKMIGEKPILGIIKRIWSSGRFQVLLDNGIKISASRNFLIHLKIKRV